MDCLDRTNVVQSALARTVITRQLIDCGIFKETDRVDMFPDFEHMFRNSTAHTFHRIWSQFGQIMPMSWVRHIQGLAPWKQISLELANDLLPAFYRMAKIQSRDMLRTTFSISTDRFVPVCMPHLRVGCFWPRFGKLCTVGNALPITNFRGPQAIVHSSSAIYFLRLRHNDLGRIYSSPSGQYFPFSRLMLI